MLNFIVCDDNKLISDRLSKILESIFIKHDIDAKVSLSCTNPDELIEYMKTDNADVLFLDIDLKHNLSGIDLANSIRRYNKEIYIIFISGHLEYILLAYKCKTFDFIPKPVTLERIEETILRLMDDISGDRNTNSFIRINNKNTIINQNNVNFIKKDGMKLVFYTDTRVYETYSSFNKIANELPNNFVRCHKSYIANVNNIAHVHKNDNSITFLNDRYDTKCYIGPKYKDKIMEVLNDGIFTNNLDSINNRK